MTTSQAYLFILLLPFVCTVVCYCTWHLLEFIFTKIRRLKNSYYRNREIKRLKKIRFELLHKGRNQC